MNITNRESDHDDEEWWGEAALMPGMYITVLKGKGEDCHEKVKSPIYPFTNIAYFVTDVKPECANVIDLAHNNTWVIKAEDIKDYELVRCFHNKIKIHVEDIYWYSNRFLMGDYKN